MTSTQISSNGSHAGKHKCRPGALAAVIVGGMLALSPSAAMGQADDQYLPPDTGPGNDGGSNGGSQTPSSTGGSPSDGGSSGSGGSGTSGGNTADSSGGTEQADSEPVSPAGPAESSSTSSAPDDDGGSGGSDRRSHGDGRDPAKELADLSANGDANGDAVNRPRVALGDQAATDSSTATIAIVAGIMLAITAVAVLMRRRLSGSRGNVA